MRADLLLTGGLVLPVAGDPIPGGAVAMRGEQIVAVGRPSDVEPVIGPGTRVIKLRPEQTVVPGFNDSHQHILLYAERRTRVQLWQTRTVAEVLELIAVEAARRPPGTWILAVGHDQGRLAEGRHPTRAELDAVAPQHPVFISRACGHIALTNSAALAAAGVTIDTPDPPDGRLERVNGELTGVLQEGGMRLVRRAIPEAAIDWNAALRTAAADYHQRGITSIGEAAVRGREDADRLRQAIESGAMRLRVYMMPIDQFADQVLAEGRHITGAGDAWLRWGSFKIMADGTLGGGTAWITEDYVDEPGNRGWTVITPEALHERVEKAHRAGFQIATHAIGDATVAMVVDAYERAIRQYPRPDHRHRVEHVEVVHPGLPERMARLGIIASVQSCFTFWEYGDVTRLGPGLAPYGHAWGGLHRAGVKISNGSDNPVLPDFAPLQGIYAAVARKNHAGLELAPHQAMDVQTALWTFTAGGAYASFEEGIKGTLEAGKLADVAVLSGNLLDPDVEHLRALEVDMTIAGGQVVFERG